MSYLRAISFNCMAAIFLSQLYAVPANAGNATAGTGVIVFVGAKSQHIHNHNNIRIHRHYASPKAYTPKALHAKPVARHDPYALRKPKKKSYLYLYGPWYGSKRQYYHRRSFGHGY